MNLLGRCKIVNSIVPTAGSVAGCTEVEIDCAGFDRVLHIVTLGAAGTAATYDFKIQEAAATGMGSASDITGGVLVQVLEAGASKIYAIDVPVNAAKPFQIAVAAVGTQTMANAAVAILYEGSGSFPKTAATQAIIL